MGAAWAGTPAGGGSCESGTAGADAGADAAAGTDAAVWDSTGTGTGMVMPDGGATGPLLSGAPCEPGAGPLRGGASDGTGCPE